MYRAYQPLFPAASRYLQEKWAKADYQEHRRKVQLAVPVVNTTALPTPPHLQVNLKKMQLEKERQAVRDRDDLLHYARLVGIEQSRGRVDNWNFYCRHSLNWEKRQRDHKKICWENQQLMKRLHEKKSELAQGHWHRDWHREQIIRNSLARYPRGTRSCQAGMERWRQRIGDRSPTSVCEGSAISSPARTHFLCGGIRTGPTGERFWGSKSKPLPEGQVTTGAFSPNSLRKRDVTRPPGSLAQWTNEGTLVSAMGFSTKEVDGSLARADFPGGASLQKSIVEAATAPSKRPPSSHLKEKPRFSKKNPTPALKKMDLSAKCTASCYRRTKEDSKSDG